MLLPPPSPAATAPKRPGPLRSNHAVKSAKHETKVTHRKLFVAWQQSRSRPWAGWLFLWRIE